ncbi:MAG: GAF domain-containing protein [Candidatus Tectomicrobia bacterium]|nr:GAF domain-containing protein [Candidatus Tectomicrobia bacterium]
MDRKILVAEDSPTQAEHIRLLLEKEGYRVILAANGREGLEKVHRERPDLIISDIVMPEVDGYAFCQAVKSNEATKRIPVVLLTGSRGPGSILQGLQLEVEVLIQVGGRELHITADKQQIIELLFSTFEDLARLNDELKDAKRRLENYARNLESMVQERTERLSVLNDLNRKITESLELSEVLQSIVQSLSDLLQADTSRIFFLDRSTQRFVLRAGHGRIPTPLAGEYSLRVGEGLTGAIGRTGEPILAGDVDRDERWQRADWAREHGIHSYIGYPLIQKGEVTGVICCMSAKKDYFTKEHLGLLENFAASASIAIENAETHSRLEESFGELRRSQQMVIRAEKLSALGTLAAGAAHEVLNPANIIGLYAQRILNRSAEGSDERKEGEVIWRNVERISQICDSLRRFSRNEPPKSAPFRPEEAIGECLQLLGHKLRLASINVERKGGLEAAEVQGDRNQMVQVFLNLITNAVDAMPGGGTLSIASDSLTEVGGRWWEVRFSDTGQGILEEVLPRIFDPFFTTKPEEKGTGLGLAVTHGIIDAHGGKIWAESPPGQGATFVVRLPLPEA